MSTESVMPSNHLILCDPLLLPSIFPSIRVFSKESAVHIRWPLGGCLTKRYNRVKELGKEGLLLAASEDSSKVVSQSGVSPTSKTEADVS